MTTSSTHLYGDPGPERPDGREPLQAAADYLQTAALLVERAARQVTLAASLAPIGRIIDTGARCEPYRTPLGENPALTDLTKYAATLAGESQTLMGHSYTCGTATQDGRDREALKNAGPLR